TPTPAPRPPNGEQKASRCTFSGQCSARQALAGNSHHQSAPFLRKGPKPHPYRVSLSSGRFSSSTSGEQTTIAHLPGHNIHCRLTGYVINSLQRLWPYLTVRAVVVNHHMVILLKRPGRLRPAVSQTARCTDITTGGIAAHQP